MKTITGSFLDSQSNPAANSVLYLYLSQDAVAVGTGQIVPRVVTITLTAGGAIPGGTQIWCSDELSPSDTYYTSSLVAPGGATIWGPENLALVGLSPINLNLAQPVLFGDGTMAISTAVLVNPSAGQTIVSGGVTMVPLSIQAFPGQTANLLNIVNSAGTPIAGFSATGNLIYNSLQIIGLITSYNGINTVSNGVPTEISTVDLIAQTAAITTTTLYTSPAAGQYRLSWNAKVTTPATTSTLGPLTIGYTDPDGVAQSIVCGAQNPGGVSLVNGSSTILVSSTGNTATTILLGLPVMLNCKVSTPITYAFAYTSNSAATMNYNLHLKLECLG